MSPLTNITSLANEVNYGLNTPIYIVGGGSFAIKLANVLIDNQLEFEFIDEFASSLLLERNVYKAHSIPSPLGIFFIAISIDEYALAAISRLAQQGVKKEQCLPLKYDSDSIMLGHMFTHNRHKLLELLAQPLSSVKELESSFYIERNQFFESSSAQKKHLIGICCLGRGGGYLGHLGHIPTWLAAHHNTVTLSDSELDLQGTMPRFLMGQSAMNAETSLDLVITAHVFPCSPRQTKKLSFCHMIYDFLLFNQQTYEHLQQAQTHYVFLPSSASMKMHQDICLQNKFENNIVLIPGGYPRHDNNMRQYHDVCATQLPVDSILYAPTLSSLPAGNETYACYSIISALQFVPEILARFSDKKLIFRPHPEDLALVKYSLSHPRAQAFAELLAWCEQHPRCEIDVSQQSYLESFARSALIISDTSSVAFSFALLTGRPVILFSSDHHSLIQDYNQCQFILDKPKFAHLVNNENDLYQTISELLLSTDKSLAHTDFCKSSIFNLGHSEDYLYQHFDYILQDKRHPDWWYLRDHIEAH